MCLASSTSLFYLSRKEKLGKGSSARITPQLMYVPSSSCTIQVSTGTAGMVDDIKSELGDRRKEKGVLMGWRWDLGPSWLGGQELCM